MKKDYKTIYSSTRYFSESSIILDNIITICEDIKSELHSVLKKRGVENHKSVPIKLDYEINDYGFLISISGYVEVPFTLEEEEEIKKDREARRHHEKYIQYIEFATFLENQKKYKNIKTKEDFNKAFDAGLI